ncbi:unnamed protein product [Diabrotica balteata]|uniref:Uncharacterized protein n=1 Tax=Diabrotica balteata TaxID=107213 RepID=A0A9N9TDT4_DIABA|nr:unnamed protein product [Diabrotica balteata]
MEIKDLADLYGDELKLTKLIRKSSARALEIAKRQELDSSDGQVIDDHDQFYRDHKLILLLFRTYGFISEIMEHGITFSFKEMGLLVASVYCMVLLYIYCDCSHKASDNIALRVQRSLMEIDLTTINLDTGKEALHKTEFSKLEECENRKQVASKSLEQASSFNQGIKSAMKQISLQEFVDKMKQWDNNSLKLLAVDNCISKMVALEDLPFSFVESVGFTILIKHLCPPYNLKSRQYFTSFICDKLFGKVSQKILELLKSFEKLSLTTDIWSDNCSGVSLLSLTCHGITKEFERKMIVLKAEVFNEDRHTGESIAHKLKDILSFWEIPKENEMCSSSCRCLYQKRC